MKFSLFLTCLFFSTLVSAQNFWFDIPENVIPLVGERRIQPQKSRTIKIEVDALKPILAAAPLRFSPESAFQDVILDLPTPDGRSTRFLLTESPVMPPSLQAKYPDIRCYTGTGIDDPTAVLKCDLTPYGFHAQVLRSSLGDWYIDPYSYGDVAHYNVYFKRDLSAAGEIWECQIDALHSLQNKPPPGVQLQGDCKLRQYTLALACTGEYAAFFGGTVPAVESAFSTSINRVNGVYEIDFAVTMSFVANNDTLIFLDGNTDPYTNNDGVAMLTQNQTTCNNRIGLSNYDIGHVFSTGGGGVANLGCVCTNNRAKGVTGSPSPTGDAFDIDYVAHEMGHQFGCDHTFNGTHGSCNGNRVLASAFEPGSGSTIMAYAGICDDQDIQPHSDAYFHARSLQQAGGFVTGSGHTCDTEVTTGNSAPTVNAGLDYTIPRATPFVLTATGSDPNGNSLTYCWEQYDNQNSTQPPLGSNTGGPNFRSFDPTSDPQRYCPNLESVIDNSPPTWEVLPTVGRTMNFRVTVRDNYGGAGCTKEDNMVVTVAGAAGPFEVSVPNTALTWDGNTTQTVIWNVAGTSGSPVSCANVKISLSTDGGYTYPTVILGSTANDGSENITVPNTPSNTCRIKIEGVNNIFYDISNTNFTILAGLPVELMAIDAQLVAKNNARLNWRTATEKDNQGFEIQQAAKNGNNPLEFQTIGFVDGYGNSNQPRDYNFEVTNLTPGDYYFRLRQVDFNGAAKFSPIRALSVRPALLVTVLPNPVEKELKLEVFQEKASQLGISISNQWGQVRELLNKRESPAGTSTWRFDASEWVPGAYYLLFYQDGAQEPEKKLILKK